MDRQADGRQISLPREDVKIHVSDEARNRHDLPEIMINSVLHSYETDDFSRNDSVMVRDQRRSLVFFYNAWGQDRLPGPQDRD